MYVITAACTKCPGTPCVDVCPVDCIHPKSDEDDFASPKQLFIDPNACIDCSYCVPVCPPKAIFPWEELPDAVRESATEANAAYFS